MVETTSYLDHFELNQSPFRQEPDPRIFYQGAGHPAVLHSLLSDIHAGKPLTKLTGREGVGKTLISVLLTQKLPSETFEIIILDHPAGSYEDLLRIICLALDQGINDHSVPIQYLRKFREILQRIKKQQRKVLLIIDESEKIFLATLERLIKTICDTDEAEVLQILLIGRLELDHNLDQLKIYCSNIDIHTGYTLDPLDLDQTEEYLQYRLQSAGIPAAKKMKVFDEDAVWAIYEMAGGNVKLTNTLAEKGLREASAVGSPRVSEELIPYRHNLKRIESSVIMQLNSFVGRNKWWMAAGAFLLLLLVLLFSGEQDESSSPNENEKAAVEEIIVERPEIKIPEKTGPQKDADVAGKIPDSRHIPKETAKTERKKKIEEGPQRVDTNASNTSDQDYSSDAPENIAGPTPVQELKREEQREILQPRDTKKKVKHDTALIVVEAQARKKKIERQSGAPTQKEKKSSTDATHIFNERIKATSNWLAWSYRGGYTIQLMMLTADDAEENLKNIIVQKEYATVRDDMYIIKRNSPPAYFVFYGLYDTLEEARQSRNKLPSAVRGHQPYALSIEEALKKTREE